jgi:hypothetical protein
MRRLFPINIEREILTLLFQCVMGVLVFSLSSSCNRRSEDAGDRAQASAEAEAYKEKIELSHIGLAKGENYLGDEIHYVEGTAKNDGDRIVQRIELTFVFKDSLKQMVLKESRKAVDFKGARGLESQKSTRFQVGFDHLPKGWNYFVPEVYVSKVILK